ncbi:polyisoprenoid-binding protein [Acetobacter cibinongensis]|uniref:Polyisoprenoid-binding protein n=2 Tax=Acetobacter cibinongensis TaxID=146475 RepID=A0A0D6N1B2_9PROT|nr:hypothetical protein Abci_006_004 [Acetobacter cibinongensis]GEL57414.1 polyisoprenoid-binding protein [Acetobacter cibinongensis]
MRWKNICVSGLAVAVMGVMTAGPVKAAGFSEVMAQAPQVQAGHYKIESNRTQVLFSVSCLSMSHYRGLFSGVTGDLSLDPEHPERSKVHLIIPLTSLTTTTDEVGQMLRQRSWLDVSDYPEAEFTSTNVVYDGPSRADVAGTLTLRGVTHPVTFKASFLGAGPNVAQHTYNVGFEVRGTISRSAFGMVQSPVAVGDDVTLTASGVFEKYSN